MKITSPYRSAFVPYIRAGVLAALITCFSPVLMHTASADPIVTQSEGIAGYVDDGHRNPILTVSHEIKDGGVLILADAREENDEFLEYPIQFSFFVNRELFKTQIRTPAQGNSVGVFVPSTVAAAPFNYSVLATVVHPNRQYSTYFEGTTFESQLATSLTCDVSVLGSGTTATEVVYSAEDVSTLQSGNDTIQLSFLGKTKDDVTQSAQISTTLTVSDGKASGTVSVTPSNTDTAPITTATVTGTSTLEGGALTALEASAADGKTSISCSKDSSASSSSTVSADDSTATTE